MVFAYLAIMNRKVLYIDAGNTRLKAAEYVNDRWKFLSAPDYADSDFEEELYALCKDFDWLLVTSVKKRVREESLRGLFTDHKGPKIHYLTTSSFSSASIRYRTPDTLGVDRYLACLGAWSQHQHEPVPVIVTDAGTACTIDIMDERGVFLGGVIMPGLHLLIDCLARKADGLFDIEPEVPDPWPPDSTTAALQAGTAGTFLAAWEAHVQQSLLRFPEASLWLTGGDAAFLASRTSRNVQKDPHLVLTGMREFWKKRLGE